MEIKIGGTRKIELLSAIKNIDAINFKIGDKYAELTTDITKTNGSPQLKFSKDGNEYYVREKFTVPINEIIFDKTYTNNAGKNNMRTDNFKYTISNKFTGQIILTVRHTKRYGSGQRAYVNSSIGNASRISGDSTATVKKSVIEFTGDITGTVGTPTSWKSGHSSTYYSYGSNHLKIQLIGEKEV